MRQRYRVGHLSIVNDLYRAIQGSEPLANLTNVARMRFHSICSIYYCVRLGGKPWFRYDLSQMLLQELDSSLGGLVFPLLLFLFVLIAAHGEAMNGSRKYYNLAVFLSFEDILRLLDLVF